MSGKFVTTSEICNDLDEIFLKKAKKVGQFGYPGIFKTLFRCRVQVKKNS